MRDIKHATCSPNKRVGFFNEAQTCGSTESASLSAELIPYPKGIGILSGLLDAQLCELIQKMIRHFLDCLASLGLPRLVHDPCKTGAHL